MLFDTIGQIRHKMSAAQLKPQHRSQREQNLTTRGFWYTVAFAKVSPVVYLSIGIALRDPR